LLLGPAKVLRQEQENIQCRSIDIELPAANAAGVERIAGLLRAEALNEFRENICAYRGPYRWVPSVEQVHVDEPSEPEKFLRAGGTYVITGGTGAIGLTIAKHMAETAKANLLLTSRSGLPPREEWKGWLDSHDAKDATSDRIRQIQELERLGAKVIVAAADSANEEQMRDAIALAKKKFGAIHGVVHAAGIPGGSLIAFRTRDAAESVLGPKVAGTLLLESLTEGEPLDFFVLCSSVNAIFGGIGAVDYCAACAFQDALAVSRGARNRGRMISIGWDAWREAGMAVNVAVPLSARAAREESLSFGILPGEGIQALGRIVAGGFPQTVVATRDLRAIIDWNGIYISKDAKSDTVIPAEVVVQNQGAGGSSSTKHARPDLPNDYVAPRNDQERSLAAVWSELLGIDPVGVHDNFFDLGGHSLLATRVLSRVQELFKVRLPLRTIFEAPTIAEFVERLQTVSWALQSPVAAGGDGESAREEIDL
jgi:NAD(P)-dependent dehydrogenase (short-subunit alcohol dehydrogenase family)/acyl carrier protein